MTTKENLQRIKHEFIECMVNSGISQESIDPKCDTLEPPVETTARFLLRNLNELIKSFPDERFYIDRKHPGHIIDSKNNEKYLSYKFNFLTRNNLKEICDLLNAGDKALNKKSAPQPKLK